MLLAILAMGTARLYAAEAYAVAVWDSYDANRRLGLTFYYDNNRSSHENAIGEYVFSLNSGSDKPEWILDRPGLNPNDISYVQFDSSFANYRPTSTSHWFDHLYGLESFRGTANLNTSQTTNMSYMFFCTQIEDLDLRWLNVSNVTDMSYMLAGCRRTQSLNISGWNTSKVTNMSYMFEGYNQPVLNLTFDTSSVTDMSYMFYGAHGLQWLTFGGDWSTANVVNMESMFSSCESLGTLDLNNWNVSKVTNMSDMFDGCELLSTLYTSGWNTASVTNMSGMFCGCEALPSLNAQSWNTANVTNMSSMFYGCKSLQTITWGSNWNTGKVETMSNMFRDCENLKQNSLSNVANWNIGSATRLSGMFYHCKKLTSLNLSSWNTSKVTDMSGMFDGCTSLGSVSGLNNWNTASATSMASMFKDCSNLTTVGGLTSLNTSNVTDMSNMFNGCAALQGVSDLTSWNTSNVTDMSGMFQGCNSITSLNLSGWDNQELTTVKNMFKDCNIGSVNLSGWNNPQLTSISGLFMGSGLGTINMSNFVGPALTDISDLFRDCFSLSAADLSSWNTPNIANMRRIFYGCHSLQTINMDGWSTDQTTDIGGMFYGCYNLAALDLSSWNTSNVTNMSGLFNDCFILSDPKISNWNTDNVTSMYSLFSDCKRLTEIDLSPWNTANVTDMGHMFDGCTNLTTIYVGGGWSTEKVTDSYEMFEDCLKLVGGCGTTYTSWHIDKSYACIDGGADGRGYLSPMPYVVYANGALTFYADGNRDAHAEETIYYLNSDIQPPSWLEKKDDITTVVFDPSFANVRPTSANSWFGEMTHLTSIEGLEYLHTDFMTTTTFMFYRCSSLRSLDLSHFNTANVENMQGMFELCLSMTQLDLSSFNTSKVTDMRSMFYNCNNLTTISVGPGWNTDAVENSAYMFENCAALKGSNGTAYQSSNPKDKTYAHIDAEDNPGYLSDQTLMGIYVSFVPETGTLTFRHDVRRGSFGDNAFDLNQNDENPGWYANRKAVTNVVFDFSFSDVHPKTAYSWFRGMSNLTDIGGIEYLCTDSITNMESMFFSCSKLTTLDLSAFNTSLVQNMENMFGGCSALTAIYVGAGWNTENVTMSLDMFEGCASLVGGNGTAYDENHTDKEYACLNGGTAIPSYLTDNLPQEPYAIYSDGTLTFCYDGLKTLRANTYDLNTGDEAPGWLEHNADITAVVFDPTFVNVQPTSTYGWFDSMSQLSDISGLQYLNTSQVTNMASMFNACTGLTILDLGSFATANVENMSAMFSGCSALTTIYAGTGWSTASVTASDGMFAGCLQLAGAAGTQFNPDNTNADYAVVDGINDAAGYLSYMVYATITHAYGSDMVYNYLTFFYDGMHAQRSLTEPVYRLNTGTEEPEWLTRAADFHVVMFDRSFQSVKPTTTYHWFRGMTALTTFTCDYLNTSEVTNMSGMFEGCTALTTFMPKGWNTGKVTDMSSMFKGCTALTDVDMSSLNTAQVANMSSMFQGCTALTTLGLNAFATSHVTNMSNMFNGCSALTTISVGDDWSTGAVTSSTGMFTGCTSIQGSSGTTYNASYTDKSRARVDDGTSSPGYLSYLTSEAYAAYNPTTRTLTFYHDRWRSTRGDAENTFPITNATAWRKDIVHVVFDPSFDDVRPTETAQWFYNRGNLEDITGIEYLHTESVTNMASMFSGCSKLSAVDLSHFNTCNVTNMRHMFYQCSSLTTLDLSSWETGNVTDMTEMFRLCTSLETIYVGEGWNTDNVTSSSQMFWDCNNLHGSSYTRYNSSNPDDKTYARVDQGTTQPGYLSLKAKAYAYVFDGTLFFRYDGDYKRLGQEYTLYDISDTGTTPPGWAEQSAEITGVRFEMSFNKAYPTSTYMWFANMPNLTDIVGMDEYLVTDSVTNMSYMFSGCSSLTELNLLSFNTQHVTDMSYMFARCSALTEIDLSGFVVQQVTNMTGMFQGCSKLQTINVRSDWNPSGVFSGTSANMFAGCFDLVGEYGTDYDASHTDIEYARLDRPSSSTPGYLTRMQGAYANLTSNTLTFYCDDQRSLREGLTFSLNTGDTEPEWSYSSSGLVMHVVFDPSFDNARPTSTVYWFSYMQNLEDIVGIKHLHTDKVTDMSQMFENCSKLTSLDVSHFDTRNVTSMRRMFYGCQRLETLATEDWNTQSLRNASYMFMNCTSLTELNLSGWNTSNLQYISNMFYGCSALNTIYAADWNLENITQHDTFQGCIQLVGGANTTYTGYESATAGYDHLDGGTSNPGFFTDPAQREAYAYYSEADSTLTFCYDTKRSTHAETYDVLNTTSYPGWYNNRADITNVEFMPSFAAVQPKSNYSWFSGMKKLKRIDGLQYLNTSQVTSMYQMFKDCQLLTSLDVSGFITDNVVYMTDLFSGCSALTTLDVSGFNTSKVTKMNNMFNNCQALTTLAVSHFNTGKVTNMNYMFYNCSSLTILDVSGFNTSKVTNMGSMFSGCEKLTSLDVSGFNTSKVTNMSGMFSRCKVLTALDVSGFNTGNATDMNAMFNECQALTSLDVSGFITDKVTNMQMMFYGCKALTALDVSSFNTANVMYMTWMFGYCSGLTSLDVSNFDTSKVTTFGSMFSGCKALTELDLSNFDTSNATNISAMFSDCYELISVDVSSFDTSKATSLGSMFFGCKKLTELDLSSWNTANVTSFYYTFYQCYALKTIYVGNGWNTDAVTESRFMFTSCTKLVGGNGTVYSDSHSDKEYARIDGGTDNPGYLTLAPAREAYACYTEADNTLTFYYDIKKAQREGTKYAVTWTGNYPGWTNWNDGNEAVTTVTFDKSFNSYHGMTKTGYMFVNMKNLTTINNLQYLHTENVTNMENMFALCGKLTDIDVTHFDTHNVTNMGSMFRNCSLLTQIDVSNFNTSKVTSISMMFYSCKALTSLDISHFDTSKITSLFSTFSGCESLTELDLSNFSSSSLRDTNGTFEGCKGLTRLDISNLNTSNVTRMSSMFQGCSALTSLDVSHFDTQNATEMTSMFAGCQVTSLDLSGFNTAKVTKMAGMFQGCSGLTTLDVSNFDTHNVESMISMFNGCRALTSLDVSGFNTDKVTNMSYMFNNCQALTTLDLSGFNTANVTSMSTMFSGCRALTSLDVSGFNTANVTSMYAMFNSCQALTTLDLSGFNTANVTNMYAMFASCSNLTTIYCNHDWQKDGLNSDYMFNACSKIKGGAGTTYNSGKITAVYAHVDAADNPGYFTYKANFQIGDVNGDGSITIADVTALVNIILGKDTTGQYNHAAADVNGDNSITIADVTALVNIILGK